MYGRILIVDDVATNRIIYKVKMGDAFYQPLLAVDGKSCLSVAQTEHPDLILLDLNLPDISGIEVIKLLRADPLTSMIPVVVLTACKDIELQLAALSAGADDVMTKPVPDQVLLSRVRNLLRAHGENGLVSSTWGMPAHVVLGLDEAPATFERSGTVAIVTPHKEQSLLLKHEMQGLMRDKLVLMSRDEAMAIAPSETSETRGVPDVFLISADIDGTEGGLRLMSELKCRPATRHAVVCIITSGENIALPAVAYDLGADDVVSTQTSARELVLRIRILLRRKRKDDLMRATVEDGLRLAVIDPLTGIYNRRYALPRLVGIATQASQAETEFAVMVVDLDRFKSVNDRFGHAAGDAVLVEVARRLSENLRMSDLLARIGGEEFLVALPDTSFADAELVAARLCAVIGDTNVALPSGETLKITASIGVALGTGAQHHSEDVNVLIERADQALMHSKHAGRNQVTFHLSAA